MIDGGNVATAEPEKGHIIDREKLSVDWPTHAHDPAFWQELGRSVATFGLMEEMLGKAIFALTGNKAYDPEAEPDAFQQWIKTLEKALTDQLGGLIESYAKALKENERTKCNDYAVLINELKEAKDIRNVLCHGSWGNPDDHGRTIPKFVNKKLKVFETPVDVDFLKQTHDACKHLICDILDSITAVGYKFPGSDSPGEAIW